jgi:hypothetical protein
MASLRFVHVEPAADGKPGAPSTVDRRAIRSQAMKDFRRRQREEETISFMNADRNGTSAPSQNNTPASDRHDSGSQKPDQDGTSTSLTKPNTPVKGRPKKPQLPSHGFEVDHPPFPCCVASGSSYEPTLHISSIDKCCNDCLRIRNYVARQTLPILVPQTIRSPVTMRGPMLQSHIEAFYPSCVWSNLRMLGVLSNCPSQGPRPHYTSTTLLA